MRPSGRAPDALRPVSLEGGVAKYAEGSCLAKFGDTHVLCTASVEERVPPFSAQHRQGLGHRRIRHAAALDPNPHRPRGGARPAERAHPGNPAADRAQPARGDRSRRTRRAPDPHRLRCAAGRWRHPHRRRHRQLCGAPSGARRARRRRAAPGAAARRQRRRGVVRDRRRRRRPRPRLRRGFAGDDRCEFRADRQGRHRRNPGDRRGRPVRRRAVRRDDAAGARRNRPA